MASIACGKPDVRPSTVNIIPKVRKVQRKRWTELPAPVYSPVTLVRRRYARAWKHIRDSYVQQHSLCELCQEKGLLVPTEEVHHKIPLSEGGTHARDNLIALCKSCHARIHADGTLRHERGPLDSV